MLQIAKLLPFTEPVYIFTILITAIFLAPFLFRWLKIPDVAAFIIAGILIGPYGFHLVDRDSGIELLGTVGLLYIMFIMGLELDPENLKKSRRPGILFGIFTFLFPFLLGWIVSRYLLNLDHAALILVSIMFSSHTLIAYPIVRNLGVNRDLSVLTAIGGTIITDTLVLLVLSIATQTRGQETVAVHLIKILLLFALFLLVIFYTYPRISRWFFANVKRDRPVHFLFLIMMVSISSVLAKLIGFEPIIGAFVAGMALSRTIPRTSMLMHHVDFVGNILFIPVFLIVIGMMINLRVLFTGATLWYIAALLITTALAGKWIAAYVAQKSLGFSRLQRDLLFGLSSSRAAATIAVVLIGFERQLIDENILNATVLVILFTCMTASHVTDRAGKKMVVEGSPERDDQADDIILVPISNPSNMATLVYMAKSFQEGRTSSPIYVLSIIPDDQRTRENLVRIRKALESNVSQFNNLSESVKVITRVDLNVSSGILRAAKEYLVSDIIFGWGGRSTPSKKIFGSVFDQLVAGDRTLYACNIRDPIQQMEEALVLLPPGLEYEISCTSIMHRISRLPLKQGATIRIQTPSGELPPIIRSSLSRKYKVSVTTDPHRGQENFPLPAGKQILNILFILRKQSVSYNSLHNSTMRKLIARAEQGNFLLIVPGFK